MNWSRTFKAMLATVFVSSLLIFPSGMLAAPQSTVNSTDNTTSRVTSSTINGITVTFSGRGKSRNEAKAKATSKLNTYRFTSGQTCNITRIDTSRTGDRSYFVLVTAYCY